MKLKMPMLPPPRRPKAARPPKPKLNAIVRASMARTARAEDFEEEDDADYEPNMKLSHAFMVVLVLHLVAIGGVLAFNALQMNKDKRREAQSISASAATAPKSQEADETDITPAVEKNTPATATAVVSAPASGKTGTGSGIHEVTSGETLKQIAAANKVSVEALEKENGLSTYSVIKPGQRLKIPGKAAESKKAPATASAPVAAKAPATSATTVKSATATEYTVAKGDNPYSIAKKFKVSYSALLKANNIDDPTKLQIGQKLVIPKTATN